MSVLLTQSPGDTVQSGTGKVDPASKFKCTTAAVWLFSYTLGRYAWDISQIYWRFNEFREVAELHTAGLNPESPIHSRIY